MKIGMLIPEFPTQTHIFFWREIQALRSLGHEVFVLSTRRPTQACPHEFGAIEGPRTHYVYPPEPLAVLRGMSNVARLPALFAYVASLATPEAKKRGLGYALCAADLAAFCKDKGIEHIHVHSCAEAAHVVAMAHRLGGPHYSLHLHGDLKVYGTDHEQKMRDASFVAAAAAIMQQQIVDGGGIPYERTCRMVMGVDFSNFAQRAPFASAGPLHVVSISRLAECKGHGFGFAALKGALATGADIRYSVAGSGHDDEEQMIRAEVVRLGLSDRVDFVGPLSERGVAELLARADVFLLSSAGHGEASPVAVMEAMARGVPAICSIIGGTPDMIDDEQDGLLIAQRDVAGLQAALLRLYNDRALLQRLGDGARKRAQRDYDALHLAANLVARIEDSRRAA